MDAVDVIAVAGACGPERTEYAAQLAAATGRTLVPATRLADSPDPADEAAALASWRGSEAGAVVEVPDHLAVTELIGALADGDARTRMLGLVCVVDAAHVFDDLHRDDDPPARTTDGGFIGSPSMRAQLTVAQIELASVVVLVNWAPLPADELCVVMALLSHLSPRARLKLDRAGQEHNDVGEAYAVEQDRAGWVCILNGDFDPHMTDRRVTALRYEQARPLHPGRLKRLLIDRIGQGEFGRVIRSVGFCRLATRANVVAQWDHVGRVISLNPLAFDDQLTEDDDLLSLGQDLAIIGLDLAHDRLIAALDEAALTDDELTAGPSSWRGFPDPFPLWVTATDRSE